MNKQETTSARSYGNSTGKMYLKILEVLDDPIPILLEGSTGVGKSASVMEASQQSGRTLVRYNMSSRVTIDDLLGKSITSTRCRNSNNIFEICRWTIYYCFYKWLLDTLR